jgi:hypothetical protein
VANPQNIEPYKMKKGQTLNPKGRPKKIPELRELLANVLGDEKDGKSAAEAILMALRNKAIKGDVRAAELLLDRAYGKVKDIDNRPNDLVITISGPTPE